MKKQTLSVALGLLLSACGGGSDAETFTIKEQTLTGTVEGQPFTAAAGIANQSFGEEWFIYISSKAKTCTDLYKPMAVGDREILLSAELFEGNSFNFDLNNNATFVVQQADGPSNTVAVQGRFELRQLSEGQAVVGLAMKSGKDSEVNGTVNVTLCE